MIFSAFQKDDSDWMYTLVQKNGKFVAAGMTAEELFRTVLGDEEWDKRIAAAYAKDMGQPPPPDKPKKIESVEKMKKRFIALGETGKPINP